MTKAQYQQAAKNNSKQLRTDNERKNRKPMSHQELANALGLSNREATRRLFN